MTASNIQNNKQLSFEHHYNSVMHEPEKIIQNNNGNVHVLYMELHV